MKTHIPQTEIRFLTEVNKTHWTKRYHLQQILLVKSDQITKIQLQMYQAPKPKTGYTEAKVGNSFVLRDTRQDFLNSTVVEQTIIKKK